MYDKAMDNMRKTSKKKDTVGRESRLSEEHFSQSKDAFKDYVELLLDIRAYRKIELVSGFCEFIESNVANLSALSTVFSNSLSMAASFKRESLKFHNTFLTLLSNRNDSIERMLDNQEKDDKDYKHGYLLKKQRIGTKRLWCLVRKKMLLQILAEKKNSLFFGIHPVFIFPPFYLTIFCSPKSFHQTFFFFYSLRFRTGN